MARILHRDRACPSTGAHDILPAENPGGEYSTGENDCLSWYPPLHSPWYKARSTTILQAELPIVPWRSGDCKVVTPVLAGAGRYTPQRDEPAELTESYRRGMRYTPVSPFMADELTSTGHLQSAHISGLGICRPREACFVMFDQCSSAACERTHG
jgi:hypothetical protein